MDKIGHRGHKLYYAIQCEIQNLVTCLRITQRRRGHVDAKNTILKNNAANWSGLHKLNTKKGKTVNLSKPKGKSSSLIKEVNK